MATETFGLAVVVIGPVDELSLRMQSLDHNGGSAAELINSTGAGLLKACQSQLWEAANAWHPSQKDLELDAVFHYLTGFGSDISEMQDAARGHCVRLAAAVWARFELKCLWPQFAYCRGWGLVGLVQGYIP